MDVNIIDSTSPPIICKRVTRKATAYIENIPFCFAFDALLIFPMLKNTAPTSNSDILSPLASKALERSVLSCSNKLLVVWAVRGGVNGRVVSIIHALSKRARNITDRINRQLKQSQEIGRPGESAKV
jgi:hypothetical protein